MSTTVDVERRPGPDGKMETREQRAARVLADHTPVDMKGAGAIIGRSHNRVRELRMLRLDAEATLADPDTPKARREDAREYLAAEAVPAHRGMMNRSPWWPAADWYEWGRRTRRLDEWYEPRDLASPGRPKGKAVVRRARLTFGQQLAELADVQVSDAERAELGPALLAAYRGLRRDGVHAQVARHRAIGEVLAGRATRRARSRLSAEYTRLERVATRVLLETLKDQQGSS